MAALPVDPRKTNDGLLSPEEIASVIKTRMPHIGQEDALEIANIFEPVLQMAKPVQDYAEVLYDKNPWMDEVQSVEQAKLVVQALSEHEKLGGQTSVFYPETETTRRRMIVISAVPDNLTRRLNDESR